MAIAQYTSVTVAFDMLCMTLIVMGIWMLICIDDIKDKSLNVAVNRQADDQVVRKNTVFEKVKILTD
jgi:hypothetical protein